MKALRELDLGISLALGDGRCANSLFRLSQTGRSKQEIILLYMQVTLARSAQLRDLQRRTRFGRAPDGQLCHFKKLSNSPELTQVVLDVGKNLHEGDRGRLEAERDERAP